MGWKARKYRGCPGAREGTTAGKPSAEGYPGAWPRSAVVGCWVAPGAWVTGGASWKAHPTSGRWMEAR